MDEAAMSNTSAPKSTDKEEVVQNSRYVDRIRFTLSDKSGVLRFENFDIVGVSEGQEGTAALRQYVLGRPLQEVSLDPLRGAGQQADPQLLEAVMTLIAQVKEAVGQTEDHPQGLHQMGGVKARSHAPSARQPLRCGSLCGDDEVDALQRM